MDNRLGKDGEKLTTYIVRVTLSSVYRLCWCLMTRGHQHRWLAVFMLAYAFSDVYADSVSPQQCCEWME